MNGVLLDDVSPCQKPAYRPGILDHDNKDDRKEIYYLLSKLPPLERLRWLEWACRNATFPKTKVRPVVSASTRQLAARARWDSAADERLTLEIFYDLWLMSVNYRVDFDALLRGLETQVRCR